MPNNSQTTNIGPQTLEEHLLQTANLSRALNLASLSLLETSCDKREARGLEELSRLVADNAERGLELWQLEQSVASKPETTNQMEKG